MDSLRRNLLKENFNFFKQRRMSKLGQVWIETVIYTLIGLAVIGILLAVSKPKIEQMKDKIVIEQTITSLNEISTRIYDVQIAPGNKRILDLKIAKGKFYVNSSADKIGWILDSNYKYSELGKEVNLGNMKVITKDGGPYLIEIFMEYYPVNLTSGGLDNYISFDGNPTPYKMSIENNGNLGNARTNVDVTIN
ncbi:MAG: hypothetical protein WCI72_04805 [archaeon]